MTAHAAPDTARTTLAGTLFASGLGLRRLVLRLAWPVAAERLALSLLAAVDAVLVGRYTGADGVAAVGLGGLLLWLPLVGALGAEVAATTLVAHDTGAGAADGGRRALVAALQAALCWGLVAAAGVALGAEPALRLMGADAVVTAHGLDFLLPAAAALPPLLLMYAANGALRGAGDTVRPMLVLLVVNAVNFVVTFTLISGVIGIQMGVLASGIGYAVAALAGGALALVLVLRGRGALRLRLGRALLRPDGAALRRFVRLALPMSAEELQFILAFLLYTRIVARAGTDGIAAHAIAMRSVELALVPTFALSTAAMTLTGQALGLRRLELAERSARAARGLALAAALAVVATLWLASFGVPGLFVDNPAVERTAGQLLRIFALAVPGMSVAAAVSGVLRGAGDVRYVFLTASACTWLVRLPVAWTGAVLLGWGAPGAWLGAVAENNLRGLLFQGRFRSGRWRGRAL